MLYKKKSARWAETQLYKWQHRTPKDQKVLKNTLWQGKKENDPQLSILV
jgi:hypothetical protein